MSAERERARRLRAEARRKAGIPGKKVVAGTPKPELYEGMSPLERLEAMHRLVVRQWTMSRPLPESTPRSDWPGEVFDIEAERGRSG